jgi:wobble nucleotide-excising tRNase
MYLKLVVAILLVASVLAYAQAQNPSTAKVNKGDAEKVVKIVSGDKAKTQTYCDMEKLASQIEEAAAKKDNKTVEELSQKIVALEKTLGPEYLALLDGFQDIAGDDQLGAEFMAATAALERLCTK